MKYKDELIKAMDWLAEKDNTIFLGQATLFSGHSMSTTLSNIDKNKLVELPVMEEVQMGMATGLSLEGYVPITIYPRFNFMILGINQLVNHIDKMESMSQGLLMPKVIIRVAIGAKKPLDGGLQHTQDFTKGLKSMVENIDIVELINPEQIFTTFKNAYEKQNSTIVVEHGDFYNDK